MMDKQILLGILMGTSHPILILDKAAAINSINYRAKKIFGFEEEDLVGKKFVDIVDPSYRSSLRYIFESAVNKDFDDDLFKFDCQLLTKKEETYFASLSIHKIVQEGHINFIVIVEKHGELKNQKSNAGDNSELVYFIIEKNPEPIALLNSEGKVTYANPAFQKYFSISFHTVLGQSFDDLIKEEEKEKYKTSGKKGNYQILVKSDKDIVKQATVSIIANYGQQNKTFHYLAFIVEDSKKSSANPNKDLSLVLNLLPDHFIKINKEGVILEVQAGDPDDLLIPADEMLMRNISEIVPQSTAELIYATISGPVEPDKLVSLCYEQVFPDNVIKHFEIRIATTTSENYILIIRNITEQVNAQQQLIKANEEAIRSAKMKDDFMSVMSHEIRTPLNAIIGMTQLLIRKNPSKEQLELLNPIKFSGENLLKIINDILDFSKIKAEKVEFEEIDFNLRKLVKNNRLTHKNQASQKGLKFKLFIDDDVPEWIKGDYSKLNQILNNLINNAIKFTEEGHVALDIYAVEQTSTHVKLLFEVSDTGIGIPSDKLNHIFDPFHQASSSTSRKFGGTGLGLSIIKNMTELQNGKIEVESEEGKGSVFKVYLSFHKSPELIVNTPYQAYQSEIPDYKLLQNFKILYVEDVESNQLLIDCLCKEWGIELELAQNGYEALEKVQQVLPDLILMDIQMPDMNGYQATEKIRLMEGDYFKNIPIIALTAEVSEHSKSHIKDVGMDDFLLKPIDTDELYEKLSYYASLHHKKIVDSQRKMITDLSYQYNYVNFSKTEELYKNDTIGFIKLLNLLIKEFEGYHVQILKAVKEKDQKGLSFVKHKVASTIQSFNLKEMADLLIKLQHVLNNTEQSSISEKDLLEQCEAYFNAIINEFHSKIDEASAMAENG